MSIGILGKKLGMTQIFNEEGLALPVTVVQAGPCIITQIKNLQKDGYSAVQIGYLPIKTNKLKISQSSKLKRTGIMSFYHNSEYRCSQIKDYVLGQEINVTIFKIGEKVNVTGKSIGKGYSGNQKRHKFKRGPMTHGSKNHRAPGSIGPGTTPGRVFPGKRMSGQLGFSKKTISNLEILGIDSLKNLIILKGNIPGKPGTLIKVGPSKILN